MDEFSFPFEPYEIQLNLMRTIKKCIENRKVGIFESPTGTGKSLSVLCSTMTWLEEEEKRMETELKNKLNENKQKIKEYENENDWVAAHKKIMEARDNIDNLKDQQEYKDKIEKRIENAKNGLVEIGNRKRKTTFDFNSEFIPNENENEKDDVAPNDYDSDNEKINEDDENENNLKCIKILYASRTHSQLEQLIEELEKTRFRPRVVTCASRSTLCINENVQKLKLNHLINEKCMELRKNKLDKKQDNSCKKIKNEKGKEVQKETKLSNCCEYFNTVQIEDVVNGILAEKLRKTSQVIKQGKLSEGCPYFSTRKSIPLCQLVLLPYQVILHKATREAWGIELKENVVILDEAHNVLNTIGSLYSAEVSEKSLTVALKLIREYIETYKLKFKEKNLAYMRELLELTSSMLKYLTEEKRKEVVTVPMLIRKLNVSHINLFKLSDYIEKVDLCKKFHGFYLRMQKNEVKKAEVTPKISGIAKLMALKRNKENLEPKVEDSEIKEQKLIPRAIPSPLFSLKSFIDSLTNKCEDGRVLIEQVGEDSKFRYVLLNPADRLAEIVDGARSTILVGGTMEPAQLLIETLSKAKSNQSKIGNNIQRFSCSHVIENNQMLSMVIERTVDGRPFQLTYQTRTNEMVLKSLGLSIEALMSHVPNGVVIFMPSYDFLYSFQKKMNDLGIMKKIEEKKKVFTENRTPSSDVWEKFSCAAKTKKGAVLFAVVGGKMSEGINFCDDLGRAVMVVGLPYPNKSSVELAERMKFLDSQIKNGGNLLYESLCMHAVNQAIGRSIRHRKDYAVVYLFDERFSKESIKNKLSAWIGEKTVTGIGFEEVVNKTKIFFAEKEVNCK